jgi:hypothetical protein
MKFASVYRSTTRDRSTPHARDGTARHSALVVPDEECPILRVFDYPMEEVATRTNGDFFTYPVPRDECNIQNFARAACYLFSSGSTCCGCGCCCDRDNIVFLHEKSVVDPFDRIEYVWYFIYEESK